jgi:dephospho-CoA kinase
MLVIGLTGGIGSGKSTVADMFAQLGAPVIDADTISHELTRPGQEAYEEILRTFGHDLVTSHGQLDRSQLRTLIFNSPEKRKQLESILHPKIYAEIQLRIHNLESRYCIIVIPLLIETGGESMVDRVLVIDTPESLQRHRACQRDQASDTEINAILNSQASRAQRLQAADDVISNADNLDTLKSQVQTLHNTYLQLTN